MTCDHKSTIHLAHGFEFLHSHRSVGMIPNDVANDIDFNQPAVVISRSKRAGPACQYKITVFQLDHGVADIIISSAVNVHPDGISIGFSEKDTHVMGIELGISSQ